MNILTIDASLTSSGWALFKNKKLIECNRFCPRQKGEERLKEIYEFFNNIIKSKKVDLIVIEDGMVMIRNMRTAGQLYELRGCLKLMAMINNIDIKLIHPSSVKSALGAKTKEECYNKLCELHTEEVFKNIGEFSEKHNKNKTDDIYDAIALIHSI